MRFCGNSPRRGAGIARFARARLTRLAPVCAVLALGCSSSTIAASPRFQAPETFRVRTRYCVSGDTTSDEGSGLARLKALEGTGAIAIAGRPAAAGECASTPGAMRTRLDVTLTETGAKFRPELLENGLGWDFVLARRRLLTLNEITYNRDDEPTIARVLYQWAWHGDLIGQLLQVSEQPVNAQASFTFSDGAWVLRDVGF
jgi:hypothetical protein